MTVLQIVEERLKALGADGLFCDDCACSLEVGLGRGPGCRLELRKMWDCMPGHKQGKCSGVGCGGIMCDFCCCLGSTKPTQIGGGNSDRSTND